MANLPSASTYLQFHDIALGVGYDQPTHEELGEMRRVFQIHQLAFDPNYMLKCFIGLKRLVKHGPLGTGRSVVLVHTGGQTGIFDGNDHMRRWHSQTDSGWLSPLSREVSYEPV